jgi:hypothetical protein
MLWEYRIIPCEGQVTSLFGVLNDAGLLGWEMVTVDQGLAYFKRPLIRVEETPETPKVCMYCLAFHPTGMNDKTGVRYGPCAKHAMITQAQETCSQWENERTEAEDA